MTHTQRKGDELAYWASAMKRLSQAAEATQNAMHPSGTFADRIFAERTNVLASPLDEGKVEEHLELIAFELGSQKVAIENRYIHAVIPLVEPAAVPGAPDILAGVINFRGGILPVFRLEQVLGADTSESACTIILGEHRPEFAFFAAAIEEVSSVDAASLRNASWQGGGDAPATLGLTDGALNILNGRTLLSDPRFFVGRQARLAHEGI